MRRTIATTLTTLAIICGIGITPASANTEQLYAVNCAGGPYHIDVEMVYATINGVPSRKMNNASFHPYPGTNTRVYTFTTWQFRGHGVDVSQQYGYGFLSYGGAASGSMTIPWNYDPANWMPVGTAQTFYGRLTLNNGDECFATGDNVW